MASIRTAQSIGLITLSSNTTLSLAASRINVGAQQYVSSSALILNTAISGAGGIDTGTIGVSKFYFVHAVLNSGALSLIASLSKTAPTGFTTFSWTGYIFTTSSSSQINFAGTISGVKTVTVLNSTGSGTYNSPTYATSLKVRLVGGGGGGGGNGTSYVPASPGIASTFSNGSVSLSAGAGGGGATVAGTGGGAGAGGSNSFSGSVIAVSVNTQGSSGGSTGFNNTSGPGGVGGPGPFGGLIQGGAGGVGVNTPGSSASIYTGSGGGGAGGLVGASYGSGGGAGGFLEVIIPVGTYSYTVGAGASGGSAGTGGTTGGAGGSGIIIIEESYA